MQKRRDKRQDMFQIPEIYKYDFESNPKPWNENGKQDMDKYFNYGFNEETWRYHAREVLSRAPLHSILAQRSDLKENLNNNAKKNR